MKRFMKRYENRIVGSISGLDRLVFRGTLRTIANAEGMRFFLSSRKVRFEEYGAWAQRITQRLKEHAEGMAARAGRPYLYLRSPQESKEDIARGIAEQDGITEGLVCVLSCVEPCHTISIRRNDKEQRPELVSEIRKCQHMYFYYMDVEFGLIHIRLQLWLPMSIQVWVNGREYLARQMDRQGIGYERDDNCFTRIDDLARAQKLLHRLNRRNWEKLLRGYARRVNPWLKSELNLPRYYWSVRSSEYATDILFRDVQSLQEIYPALIRYAIEELRSEDLLRFFGQRNPRRCRGPVHTDLRRAHEGFRVKHSAWENSIKMYDKAGSVLRIETTINNPQRFRVYREVTRRKQRVNRWVPMRKGIADFGRRVEISRAANERYAEALAVVGEPTPSHRLLDPVSHKVVHQGRSFRPLHPISPQQSRVFAVILQGEFQIQGIRNHDLRQRLFPNSSQDALQRAKAAGWITRQLRLLCAHQLIYKVPKTNYYRITKKGHLIMSTAIRFRETNIALLAA